MTSTEQLYACILPHIPQYMIALLKILLAAAPSSKVGANLNLLTFLKIIIFFLTQAKTDAINILCDCVRDDVDCDMLQQQLSTSSSSVNIQQDQQVAAAAAASGVSSQQQHHHHQSGFADAHMWRTNLDVQRHKEVRFYIPPISVRARDASMLIGRNRVTRPISVLATQALRSRSMCKVRCTQFHFCR